MRQKIRKFFTDRHRVRFTAILCLVVVYVSAQSALPVPAKTSSPALMTASVPKKKIEIIRANLLDKRANFEPQILLDSVLLFHDGAYMYCDSAYLDQIGNTFEAFSNIMVEQGDTLFLYGDHLHYDANTKLLQIRNNVRLENKNVTLFTDSLNYDRAINLAYYFEGGMLVDEENDLTSYWGQYEPAIKIATFSDSVKLVNSKMTLYSDTLKYNTDNKIATILGPSTIVSDSGVIYTKRGWYNTQNEESTLFDRSLIVNNAGNRTLTGDTVFYDKTKGYGKVFGNMYLQDTLKKVILRGHYGYFDELKDYAMATDSAFCIEYSQGDSLFLRGDTLKIETVDSTFRQIKAYYNVRFYRTDVQGVCDSMQFNTKDSILYMYKEPVLWNEAQQMSGDTIEIFMNDSTIDNVHMKNYCFAIAHLDSVYFNQLKGRDLKAFFEGKDLRYILVEGNAESIFYPEEKDSTMVGMNQTESSFLSITMKNRKIERLKLWPQSKGVMTPVPNLTHEQLTLKDFQWFDYLRPLDKDDIFRIAKKKTEAIRPRGSSDKFRQEE
jgi:lipopolysaccharide export system protein LptA